MLALFICKFAFNRYNNISQVQQRNQDTMNPSMMATRNALPLSNPATLMHIREKTADTETTTSTADVAFLKSRDSTGARLSRKMEKLFSSRKAERRQNAVDLPAKKSAFYRQFVEARAFVNTGLRR
ncbi:hypothetical protein PC129_g15736 [Phytophthora cactorum]|uniref:Uncharacterized protein n=2 Tax=Phytophthora cactorum TaxID=29920 RepID=A0A8T1CLF1_9STRA|nr:hypothetical protein PC112_g14823 [Phytophthora cactorum]KAG2887420.1 hypothetical protein PC114_g18834 [Phytophthora cactorum]KAG2923780.1 hypothetical protein PC117_g15608 [Phytophthora cactorum]KAG3011824.1 hypothetical protein PC120_g14231 [Phytophthora cactorum]KAG3142883.1 hypothetical protein C6341_g19266 [Phytophthora cactorum]